jgi:hypothetical protein
MKSLQPASMPAWAVKGLSQRPPALARKLFNRKRPLRCKKTASLPFFCFEFLLLQKLMNFLQPASMPAWTVKGLNRHPLFGARHSFLTR